MSRRVVSAGRRSAGDAVATSEAQFTAWDARRIPPAEKICDGVWSIPVEIPGSPLGYTLAYAYVTGRGTIVVDPGFGSDTTWNQLCRGLAVAGTSMDDVVGVLATHGHFDHCGLASRIRDTSGAWIGMHENDARLLADGESLREPLRAFFVQAGAPADAFASVLEEAELGGMWDTFAVDKLLEDGFVEPLSGLRAIWTPGHTPGHVCLWDARHKFLLAGDHLLPHVTSHISTHDMTGSLQLASYLRSLDLSEQFPAEQVLPGHEYRFASIADRTDTVRRHHENRLAEVRDAVEVLSTRATAWRVAQGVPWAQGWDSINGVAALMAVGEVVTHLDELVHRGSLHVEPAPVPQWTVAPGRPS